MGKWRRRSLHQGLTSLDDEADPGGPRSINDEKVAALIHKTLKTKPQVGTHWTVRALAAEATSASRSFLMLCSDV